MHVWHGWGTRNTEGESLLEFAVSCNLVIGNTCFINDPITWSPSPWVKEGLRLTVLFRKIFLNRVRHVKVIPGGEFKRLSLQRQPQASYCKWDRRDLAKTEVQSAEGSLKCVRVYQKTPVAKRDLIVECGCRQCSQGKVETLENLEERWQQGGISEGQVPRQTCCLSGKIPG